MAQMISRGRASGLVARQCPGWPSRGSNKWPAGGSLHLPTLIGHNRSRRMQISCEPIHQSDLHDESALQVASWLLLAGWRPLDGLGWRAGVIEMSLAQAAAPRAGRRVGSEVQLGGERRRKNGNSLPADCFIMPSRGLGR